MTFDSHGYPAMIREIHGVSGYDEWRNAEELISFKKK